jgi:alpha-L-fucosidase
MTGKTITLAIAAVCLAATLPARGADDAGRKAITYETVSYVPASPEKMKWWRDAKFGLFVHWGVYAVPAGLWSRDNTFDTWYKEYRNPSTYNTDNPNLVNPANYSERLLHKTNMRLHEYEKIPALFDWSRFNAQDFVDLCFASGQRYIVITSKHHDGFSMWRSDVDEWDIGDATPYGRESGRDPLKELAAACNATKTNGSPWEIKMCFYHSHCVDWHEDGAFPFDYKWQKDTTPERFQDYLDRKVKPQLTELLTGFGDIGMVWFDVPRMITTEQAIELRELVNKLNPNTISDGRLGRDQGNYVNSGDNGSVGSPVDYPWETGSSINESFGYHCMDHEHKSPEWIINKLIETVAHGGNYLLNIGPKPDGSISDEDRNTLTAVGKWTKANGEAVFGTRNTPFSGDKAFFPEWGTCTRKGGTLYLIVTRWPADNKIAVPLLQNKIKRISFLTDADRKALSYKKSMDANGNDTLVIDVPKNAPDKVATVIAVECEGGQMELAPYKHAYDAGKKKIYLSAANFHAHASNVKDMRLAYDRDEQAIVNWRYNRGRGPTVAWTYEVPEAGEYEVEIDYSLHRPHAGVPVDILIDGIKQGSFVTEETGGYDQYSKKAVAAVRLDAGSQDFAFDLNQSDVNKLYVMQLRGVYLTRK